MIIYIYIQHPEPNKWLYAELCGPEFIVLTYMPQSRDATGLESLVQHGAHCDQSMRQVDSMSEREVWLHW